MSRLSEGKMLALLKEGDREAFNTIYKTYYFQLYFHCRKYIADPEVAKDLLQNVFLRLWERREEIEIEVSLRAYLFRSAQNECLNHIRSLRPNLSLSEIEGEQVLTDKETQNSPDTNMESKEIERAIDLIIETLPEQCKKIFIMSRMKGMKNKEIANLLSISVRTVDTQIYRALKLMKKGLKDYLAND